MAKKKDERPQFNRTSKIYIDPNKYKDHLISFLKYVVQNSDIDQEVQNIRRSASRQLNLLQERYKSSTNWKFKTIPYWKIDINDPYTFGDCPTYLLIGGNIVVDNGEFKEYSLSVCLVIKGSKSVPPTTNSVNTESCCLAKYKDYERIVRRFHFDIDNSSKSDIPYSHLQIGGEFQQEYLPQPLNNLHYCFDHYLEIPRLPYPPIDFVLLIDITLRLFKTRIGNKILNDGTWRNLVKDSQNILLSDYYTKSYNLLLTNLPKSYNWHNWTLHDLYFGGKPL